MKAMGKISDRIEVLSESQDADDQFHAGWRV